MISVGDVPPSENGIALAIAFAAVIVGPFITYWIAKKDREAAAQTLKLELAAQRETTEKQIFASVRSSNRQAWINALREDVATYLSLSQRMVHERTWGNPAIPGSALEKMTLDAGKVFSAIQLRLNPNDPTHNELLARIAELNSVSQTSSDLFNKVRASVVEQAQKIFKFEWNRVKVGE